MASNIRAPAGLGGGPCRQLSADPLGGVELQVPDSLQRAFVGLRLVDVSSLSDQISFLFGDAYFAAYNPVRLRVRGRLLDASHAGFQAELKALVGCSVESVASTQSSLELKFSSGAVVIVSLRAEDYTGPEAFSARTPSGTRIVE